MPSWLGSDSTGPVPAAPDGLPYGAPSAPDASPPPAAAGAALLVRDYFAQGFYPDGTSANPNNSTHQVANISGALVKAILISSADFLGKFMDGTVERYWTSTSLRYRFNNEQGYGRIRLNSVLPLITYTSPTGLVVCDGGISGGKNNTTLSGTASPNSTETYTFPVSDTSKEMRIGLAWIDETTGSTTDLISRDLDLELQSPTGRIYYGNYFTDDNNKNKSLDAGEDCAVTPWEKSGLLDNSAWSLPTCVNSVRDTQNPTEAIYLSPDPLGDGVNDNPSTPGDEAADNQLEVGNWTLKVIGKAWTGTQRYAVAIAGPVQLGSSVRFKVLREDSLGNRQETWLEESLVASQGWLVVQCGCGSVTQVQV